MLSREAERYLNEGVMKRNARQSNRPVIPYDVIEILKIESNVINTPAAMTDPGIAYPEDDIAMNGL